MKKLVSIILTVVIMAMCVSVSAQNNVKVTLDGNEICFPDAKLLYSLFLDRMSLSGKNGLIDEEKRVYIYFSIEEIQKEFGVASQKATKMIAEIDDIKGCGLIHRKKQGQGKPAKIYVMKYTSINDEDEPEDVEEIYDKIDSFSDENFKTDVERCIVEGPLDMPLRITLSRTAPRVSEIENQDFRKSKGNNNKYNNTEINNTDFNDINPILSNQDKKENDIEERNRYEEIIKENIEYDILVQDNPGINIGGMVEIMLDAICGKRDYLNINSDIEFAKDSCYRDVPTVDTSLFAIARKLLNKME